MDDDFPLVPCWEFKGTPNFRIGDPESSRAYSLSAIRSADTDLWIEHQNKSLSELKPKFNDKRRQQRAGNLEPKYRAPKLPPLTLTRFSPSGMDNAANIRQHTLLFMQLLLSSTIETQPTHPSRTQSTCIYESREVRKSATLKQACSRTSRSREQQ